MGPTCCSGEDPPPRPLRGLPDRGADAPPVEEAAVLVVSVICAVATEVPAVEVMALAFAAAVGPTVPLVPCADVAKPGVGSNGSQPRPAIQSSGQACASAAVATNRPSSTCPGK